MLKYLIFLSHNKKNKQGIDIKPIGKIKKGGNKKEVKIPHKKNFIK